MKEYKPYKSGKVREVYDIGDSIIMVAFLVSPLAPTKTLLASTLGSSWSD